MEKQNLVSQELTPEVLISQGIQKGLSVDVMERLLAMRTAIKQERAKEEYDRAMAAFQSECPTIKKTKEVKTKSGIIAYRYAPIESIVEQVKNALQKHGFSYSTKMELLEGGVKVICRVTHTSGHSEESPMQVPFGNKTDIMSNTQVAAAAQTFAKRYAFCNAFGILTGDEDTDAQPAKQPKENKEKTEQEMYEKAKKMILASKSSDMLIQFCEKAGESKIYTKEHAEELVAIASKQVDKLDNPQ